MERSTSDSEPKSYEKAIVELFVKLGKEIPAEHKSDFILFSDGSKIELVGPVPEDETDLEGNIISPNIGLSPAEVHVHGEEGCDARKKILELGYKIDETNEVRGMVDPR